MAYTRYCICKQGESPLKTVTNSPKRTVSELYSLVDCWATGSTLALLHFNRVHEDVSLFKSAAYYEKLLRGMKITNLRNLAKICSKIPILILSMHGMYAVDVLLEVHSRPIHSIWHGANQNFCNPLWLIVKPWHFARLLIYQLQSLTSELCTVFTCVNRSSIETSLPEAFGQYRGTYFFEWAKCILN